MDFSIKACDWSKGSANGFLNGKADVVVLGVFEAQTLTGAAREMDLVTKGLLTRTVKAGDMSGKAGSTLMLTEVTGIGASRILPSTSTGIAPYVEEALRSIHIDLTGLNAEAVELAARIAKNLEELGA